jgi:hypothetical protein
MLKIGVSSGAQDCQPPSGLIEQLDGFTSSSNQLVRHLEFGPKENLKFVIINLSLFSSHVHSDMSHYGGFFSVEKQMRFWKAVVWL